MGVSTSGMEKVEFRKRWQRNSGMVWMRACKRISEAATSSALREFFPTVNNGRLSNFIIPDCYMWEMSCLWWYRTSLVIWFFLIFSSVILSWWVVNHCFWLCQMYLCMIFQYENIIYEHKCVHILFFPSMISLNLYTYLLQISLTWRII